MSAVLLPCPFCGDALATNNAGIALHPAGSTCWLAPTAIAVDVPAQVEGWNRRAPATQGDLLDAQRYRFVRDLAWYVDRGASVYNINNADSIWRSERGSVDADEVEAAIDRVRLGLEPEEDGEYDQ